MIEPGQIAVIDDTPLVDRWTRQYLDLFEQAEGEDPRVEAIGLCEPLKVRVISKGPPILYTVLKPFQKWLWKVLKRNKPFQLIAGYVTEEIINDTFGTLADDEIMLSGDYVSSTNKIKSWASECAVDELFDLMKEEMSEETLDSVPTNFLARLKIMFLKALTQHEFVVGEETLPQTNGQLMGSIISFPFLCIANAAMCRHSLETSYGRNFRLTNKPGRERGAIAPVLINGDDCVLKGHRYRLRSIWEPITRTGGLETTLGKTYFSNEFLTINSTIFTWKESQQRWVERNYINLGLMMGRRRGAGLSADDKVHGGQLGNICRELQRSCPPRMWPAVKKRFIYYNMTTLSKYPNIPWYVPEWLGGYGLPHDGELSEMDRYAATIIKMRMLHSRDFRPILPKDMDTWILHQLVEKEIRTRHPNLEQVFFDVAHLPNGDVVNLEDEFSRAYKSLVCDVMQRLQYSDLEKIADRNAVHKALIHNSNVWGRAFKLAAQTLGSNDLEPMCDEDMLYENKQIVYPVVVRDHGEFLAELLPGRNLPPTRKPKIIEYR
jgi:hypothetical protein